MKKIIIIFLCIVLTAPALVMGINAYYYDDYELPHLLFGRYDDLSEDAWYATAFAVCMWGQRFIRLTEKTMGPSNPLLREEALLLLMTGTPFLSVSQMAEDNTPITINTAHADITLSVLGFGSVDPDKKVFSDVDEDAWYFEWVYYAYKFGITSGIGNGEFGAGKPITRQDFAVMAQKAFDLRNKYWKLKSPMYTEFYYDETTVRSFLDYDQISPYALNAVTFFCGINKYSLKAFDEDENDGKITTWRTSDWAPMYRGYNGYLKPRSYIKRSEAALVYYNYIAPERWWWQENSLGS